jgi:predicted nuclease of predicted toxin-antitoxin system
VRLLLDTCVWKGVAEELETAGHDVEWSGSWPQDPGDEEILADAGREARVLVTLDKDFGELAVVRGARHSAFFALWISACVSKAQPVCKQSPGTIRIWQQGRS